MGLHASVGLHASKSLSFQEQSCFSIELFSGDVSEGSSHPSLGQVLSSRQRATHAVWLRAEQIL